MDYDRLRELQQKYDENPRRYFAPLANEYRKGGQLKRAIDMCRAQLAEMPGHMSGQIVFGQALYEAGEFEEARQVFERAIALDPENLIALRSLGDMSLQAGATTEARGWYTRLLDADPKDTVVIALVTEIDAAVDASPVPMDIEIPGVDSDAGDQEIPALEDAVSSPEPATSSATAESASNVSASIAEAAPVAPDGLERHYPVEEPSIQPEGNESSSAESLSQEELGVPSGNSAAEGLTSIKEDVNAFLWSPPNESFAEPSALTRPSEGQERVPTPAPEPEPDQQSTPVPEPVESAPAAKSAATAPEEAPPTPVASSATTQAEQSFNDAGATRAEEKTFDRAST
ncbi:MAG: tetratricopeptide repeat protein, partial [Gemmatimonadaceae bacterium]